METLRQDYLRQLGSLWQDVLSSKSFSTDDSRFSSPEWTADLLARMNAAFYLLHSRFLLDMVDAVRISPKIRERIRLPIVKVKLTFHQS
jgi:polyhydroxyalkanoate synthase